MEKVRKEEFAQTKIQNYIQIRGFKETIKCTVSLHWIQARIIWQVQNLDIDLKEDSLRVIAKKISYGKGQCDSPQQIKHHLVQLVKLALDPNNKDVESKHFKKFTNL